MDAAFGSRHGRSWLSFVAWSVVGCGYALGLLSILTIGVPVLIAAVVSTMALSLWDRARRGILGLVSGLAVPILYVAFINRSGPGEVCTTDGPVTSCVEQWSPWPWAVAGVLVFMAGGVLFMRRG